MKPARYFLATTELLLIVPAALFMAALFVRNLQPLQYEPARTAEAIVMWYAARPHTGLWVLLIALPLAVLITGSMVLWNRWTNESELRQALRNSAAMPARHIPTLLVAVATLTAAGILAIVTVHVLTD